MKFDKVLHQYLQEIYPPGTVIECIQMNNDPQPVPPGTRGVVKSTDGTGLIYMLWDTGSTLSLIHDLDHYRIIKKKGV